MNKHLQERVFSITRKMKDVPNGRNKHITFLILSGRIVSIGTNDCWNSHTMAHKLGYRFNAIHSELAAYLKFRGKKETLAKCTLVNSRINSKDEIGYSEPCYLCKRFISSLGIKKIYFTNRQGKIEKLCQ